MSRSRRSTPRAPDASEGVARLLVGRAAIAEHVARLGREIAADHPDGVVLVGVLKGALLFLADVARQVHEVPVTLEFIALSRYAPDSGRVRITHDLANDVTGADLVVVEDIVDTGLTLGYLVRQLEERGARRVRVCALLDRPVRRIVPLEVHYRGIEIPDVYALGYGLHHLDLYRNVPEVYEASRASVEADPDRFVDQLYRQEPC
ncbi:MAG TPA: phosphoribosyltransferase family protein [Acidimicrobiia bacterium]|nr:phosphoribosyltransferase family protein [Acidimicrobiia bacterium]